MKNLNMFCLTLEPSHYNFIKELGYTPVGLGEKLFNNDWLTDKSGKILEYKITLNTIVFQLRLMSLMR